MFNTIDQIIFILIIILAIIFVVIYIKIIYNIKANNCVNNRKLLNVENITDISLTDDDIYFNNLFKDITGYIPVSHDIYNVTYGEITIAGINNIKDYILKLNIKPDIFIDLGCGVGKSLVMAKYKGFNKCYGIEIIKERFDSAHELINRLEPSLKNDINIYNDDLFNASEIIPFNNINHYTIFISNLLFSNELNEKIWDYLKNILPKNSIIFVSKQFSNIQYDDYINVPMTWSSSSKCYVYNIK